MKCPESAIEIGPRGQLIVSPTLCSSCGTCQALCPIGAIELVGDTPYVCDLCGGAPRCVRECTLGAITYHPDRIEQVSLESFKKGSRGLSPEAKRGLFARETSRRMREEWLAGRDNMMHGYGGRILRVDLTSGRIVRERTDPAYVLKTIGGRGLNSRRLYDELDRSVDPLSPENMLLIGVGPLTGSLLTASAYMTISGPVAAYRHSRGFRGRRALRPGNQGRRVRPDRVHRPVAQALLPAGRRRPCGTAGRRPSLGPGHLGGHGRHPSGGQRQRLPDRLHRAGRREPGQVRHRGLQQLPHVRPHRHGVPVRLQEPEGRGGARHRHGHPGRSPGILGPLPATGSRHHASSRVRQPTSHGVHPADEGPQRPRDPAHAAFPGRRLPVRGQDQRRDPGPGVQGQEQELLQLQHPLFPVLT